MGPTQDFSRNFGLMDMEADEEEKKGSLITAVTINRGTNIHQSHCLICTSLTPAITTTTKFTASPLTVVFFMSLQISLCVEMLKGTCGLKPHKFFQHGVTENL